MEPETSDSPKRSQVGDYDVAEGYMRLAFGQAHKRGRELGLSLGDDAFNVTEQLLIAIYYLIRSRFPA